MIMLFASAKNSQVVFAPVRHVIGMTVGLVMFGYGVHSYAQLGPDAGALQQQLQREADRKRLSILPESFIKEPATPSKPKAGDQTIDVSTFKVTGITLITEEQAQQVLQSFTNRKLTFDQIKEAGSSVTSLYTQMGRVAQATIPPQDVVNGQIWIKIIEGKVGDIIIELDKQSPSRLKSDVVQKFIRANNEPGDFAHLVGLERSLALLNETPGNEVSGELIQGDQEGTSNLQVNAKDTGLVVGRLDTSNYGANNTGVVQVAGNFTLNNPSGNGDQATLDVVGSQGSVYGQFKYGMPVGYDGWRVAVGVSALDYKSLSSFSSTLTQGTSQVYGLYSTYALERGAKSNKSVVVNFENKNYVNLTSGIQSSKYQINNLSLGITGNQLYDSIYLNWGATTTVGNLSINDATQATNDANGAATEGYFGKLTFNVSATKPLPFERTNITTSVYGQLSNKNLSSAEQFYLGGPYGVRAYPVAQGGGSQGLVASIEVNHTYENKLQLGAFVDLGFVQQYMSTYANWQGQTNAANTYALFAAGPLLKYNYEKLQLSAALAFRLGDNPLYNQSGQQLNVNSQYQSVQGWIKGTIFF